MLYQVFIEYNKKIIIQIVEAEDKKEILTATRNARFFDSDVSIDKIKPIDVKSFQKKIGKLNVDF